MIQNPSTPTAQCRYTVILPQHIVKKLVLVIQTGLHGFRGRQHESDHELGGRLSLQPTLIMLSHV